MIPVVACDEYVSKCADSFDTFYRGLIPLIDERTELRLQFDKGGKRKSRVLEYYSRVAELAGSDKRSRLSDWLRHITDLRLFEQNAVEISAGVPTHKHPFFLALRRACTSDAVFLVARDSVYHSKARPDECLYILGTIDAFEYIRNCPSACGISKPIYHSRSEVYIMIHIGDRIEASGNATLVNKSSVNRSFQKLQTDGKNDEVQNLTAILECVLASEDKRTHDLFSGFAEQIARGGDGNKGVGKAIWDALKGGLELVSKAAGTSQAVGAAVEYWDTFFDVVYTSYRHKLAFLECLEFQRE